MITQISLTAWIVCTANGIYASHMDHIWIAYALRAKTCSTMFCQALSGRNACFPSG